MSPTLRIASVAIILCSSIGTAQATDKLAARRAFEEGAKDYDTAQFAKALDAFTRAYFNFSDPNFLYNIAQCHRALGHKREAIDSYRSYLRKNPAAANRPEVERIIGELNAQLDAEAAKPTAAPLVATPSPALIVTTQSATQPVAAKPVYKRAWFWGAIAGGVVAVGLGVGLGVGLTRPHAPHSDGTASF